MLVSLSIRHFVIVDGLELEFAPGFTVLTGETGAGKSILIDALLLALGERADADVVREGAARSDIAAEFRPTAAVAGWLAERELTGDDAGLVLVRRTVDAGGRSRSFINGAAVTLAQLRELGEQLVDVHGQHEHQSLLRPAAQLALLDEHGALAEASAAVARTFAEWRGEQLAREQAEAMAASALAEQERLRWIVEELGALAPAPGEWTQVEEEHRRLAHAAGLLDGARASVDSLGESDNAAASLVAAAASPPGAAGELRQPARADHRAAAGRTGAAGRGGVRAAEVRRPHGSGCVAAGGCRSTRDRAACGRAPLSCRSGSAERPAVRVARQAGSAGGGKRPRSAARARSGGTGHVTTMRHARSAGCVPALPSV